MADVFPGLNAKSTSSVPKVTQSSSQSVFPGVSIPTSMYGTSSAMYGEVSQSGQVTKTPESFKTPQFSSAMLNEKLPMSWYGSAGGTNQSVAKITELPKSQSTGPIFAGLSIPTSMYGTSSARYGEVSQTGEVIKAPDTSISYPYAEKYGSNLKSDFFGVSKPTEQTTPIQIKPLELKDSGIFTGGIAPTSAYGTSSIRYGEVSPTGEIKKPSSDFFKTPSTDESYVLNKRMEVSEFNSRLKSLEGRDFGQAGDGWKTVEKMQSDILADVNTYPGVNKFVDSYGNVQYTIPVENYQSSFKPLTMNGIDGKQYTIQFEQKMDLTKLAPEKEFESPVYPRSTLQNFFGFSTSDRMQQSIDKTKYLRESLRQTQDIADIAPLQEKSGFQKIMSSTTIYTPEESRQKYEFEKWKGSSSTIPLSPKFEATIEKMNADVKYAKDPEARAEAYAKIEEKLISIPAQERQALSDVEYRAVELQSAGKALESKSTVVGTELEKIQSSPEMINLEKDTQAIKGISEKYKEYWGTSNPSYGEFDEKGNIIQLGPMMPAEDQEKILILSKSIKENYDIISPKLNAIKPEISNLEAAQVDYLRKTARYEDVMNPKMITAGMQSIENRDPLTNWRNVLNENIVSPRTSLLQKSAAVIGRGGLEIAGAEKKIVEFTVVAPMNKYKDKGGKFDKSIIPNLISPWYGVLTKQRGGSYGESLALGIYDPNAPIGYKFNPSAAEGAALVATMGVGGYSSLMKGAGGVASGVVGETTKQSFLKGLTSPAGIMKTAIWTTPITAETVNYLATPKDERSFGKSLGNIAGGYGTLLSFEGAGVIGSTTGNAIKQEIIIADINKAKELGNFKTMNVKGVEYVDDMYKGAKDQAFKKFETINYIDTRYGKIEVKGIGTSTRATGQEVDGLTNLYGTGKTRVAYRLIDNKGNPISKWSETSKITTLESGPITEEKGIAFKGEENKVLVKLGIDKPQEIQASSAKITGRNYMMDVNPRTGKTQYSMIVTKENLLVGGRPLTAEEISNQWGLPETQARNLIRGFSKGEVGQKIPISKAVYDKGINLAASQEEATRILTGGTTDKIGRISSSSRFKNIETISNVDTTGKIKPTERNPVFDTGTMGTSQARDQPIEFMGYGTTGNVKSPFTKIKTTIDTGVGSGGGGSELVGPKGKPIAIADKIGKPTTVTKTIKPVEVTYPENYGNFGSYEGKGKFAYNNMIKNDALAQKWGVCKDKSCEFVAKQGGEVYGTSSQGHYVAVKDGKVYDYVFDIKGMPIEKYLKQSDYYLTRLDVQNMYNQGQDIGKLLGGRGKSSISSVKPVVSETVSMPTKQFSAAVEGESSAGVMGNPFSKWTDMGNIGSPIDTTKGISATTSTTKTTGTFIGTEAVALPRTSVSKIPTPFSKWTDNIGMSALPSESSSPIVRGMTKTVSGTQSTLLSRADVPVSSLFKSEISSLTLNPASAMSYYGAGTQVNTLIGAGYKPSFESGYQSKIDTVSSDISGSISKVDTAQGVQEMIGSEAISPIKSTGVSKVGFKGLFTSKVGATITPINKITSMTEGVTMPNIIPITSDITGVTQTEPVTIPGITTTTAVTPIMPITPIPFVPMPTPLDFQFNIKPGTRYPSSNRFKPTTAVHPLADYRIFFKRKFGYLGAPGKTKKVNLYKPKYYNPEGSDVGFTAARIKELL